MTDEKTAPNEEQGDTLEIKVAEDVDVKPVFGPGKE